MASSERWCCDRRKMLSFWHVFGLLLIVLVSVGGLSTAPPSPKLFPDKCLSVGNVSKASVANATDEVCAQVQLNTFCLIIQNVTKQLCETITKNNSIVQDDLQKDPAVFKCEEFARLPSDVNEDIHNKTKTLMFGSEGNWTFCDVYCKNATGKSPDGNPQVLCRFLLKGLQELSNFTASENQLHATPSNTSAISKVSLPPAVNKTSGSPLNSSKASPSKSTGVQNDLTTTSKKIEDTVPSIKPATSESTSTKPLKVTTLKTPKLSETDSESDGGFTDFVNGSDDGVFLGTNDGQAEDELEPPIEGEDYDETKNVVNTKVASGTGKQDVHTFSIAYPEDGNGQFLIFFLFMVLISIVFYIFFHNRHKIIALMIEGRQERRRRPNTSQYRRLDNNLEEVLQVDVEKAKATRAFNMIY